MINEDTWKISTNKKIEKSINMNVKNIFSVRFPYEKYQKVEKCEKVGFYECPKHKFGDTPIYLRNIIFKSKYRELSWGINMEFCIIEKSIIQWLQNCTPIY